MKILILSCNTGGGHNSCAKYIKEELEDYNITSNVVDYMTFVSKNASFYAEKLYLNSTKGNGTAFKYIYKLGETYNKTNIKSPVYLYNKLACKKLYQYILDNNYDLCIATHVFPSLCLTEIKKKHNIKFINVATDYECIPFWNETKPDLFSIPSKLLIDRFVSKKIPENILFPSGIPISTKYVDSCKKVIFNTNKKKILVTSGSMGFGQMNNIVLNILSKIDCYLIVVCGNNKKMYKELLQIKNDNLLVLGFIDNMNDYIYSSDLVITKPGGLTTTEIVCIRKPLIHMMPIPGVENYNASFFEQNKMSLSANNGDMVIKLIDKVLNDEEIKKEMIANQLKIINRYSAKSLVECIIDKFGDNYE